MSTTYLVILDGAADRPNPLLDGRTPLEAAHTPGLDALAARSQHGMLTVIGPGIWPESDSGAMALLSYDPLLHYTGRGPLEGFGLGLVAPGVNAIAFRVNFASFDERAGRLDRRTARGLNDEQLQALARAIRANVSLDDLGVGFDLTAYSRHRGILVFTGTGTALSGQVTNTDPGFRNEGPFGFPVKGFEPRPLAAAPRDDSVATKFAAGVVNAFVERSAAVLDAHPVNIARRVRGELPANLLLVRDGGDAPTPLPRFDEKFGCSISIFGQIPAEAGLATLIGANFGYSRPTAGEGEPAYLRRALDEVLTAGTDVVFIHLKGPDEPGHDNQPREKTRAIELIDEHFVRPMLKRVNDSDTIAVTSDHATPCELGIHSDDPVPAMVRKPGLPADGIARFAEAFAKGGRLPARRAVELMPLLVGGPT
ncbi:2,3-bisphosphoglycerate-independent phosphoglycerate mutase [Micromonospora sp. AMSO12t]|uniref:CMP-5'-phosphonoformate--3-phosphoglycerate phosphonoformyl transferase n=1 Tax=Micromonospora sp. AMSO12t TaxID=2650410 RepID=UPI00124B759E|nr:CMP-5'-phosphonoformate--3-phosphoglycerate phosphonoformyl transferase [Micromonospora sp. AMSO12t]KAB1159028.1 2,3-bisphosphoglycerate-independent phosphoglycerate mutase [Micromonospora sp. AMSO12t]